MIENRVSNVRLHFLEGCAAHHPLVPACLGSGVPYSTLPCRRNPTFMDAKKRGVVSNNTPCEDLPEVPSIQTTTAIYGRAPIKRRVDELGCCTVQHPALLA